MSSRTQAPSNSSSSKRARSVTMDQATSARAFARPRVENTFPESDTSDSDDGLPAANHLIADASSQAASETNSSDKELSTTSNLDGASEAQDSTSDDELLSFSSDFESDIVWTRDTREDTTDPAALHSRIVEAIDWLQENPEESIVTAARIFKCHRRSVSNALYRSSNPTRNVHGERNTHGGNNKVLTDAQEKAIHQYCYNQWQLGLGATKRMVFEAIKHICRIDQKEPPSWRWFST